MSAKREALWANRIQRTCLLEADNVEDALAAADIILSTQPVQEDSEDSGWVSVPNSFLHGPASIGMSTNTDKKHQQPIVIHNHVSAPIVNIPAHQAPNIHVDGPVVNLPKTEPYITDSSLTKIDMQPVADTVLSVWAKHKEDLDQSEERRKEEFNQFISAALSIKGEPKDVQPLIDMMVKQGNEIRKIAESAIKSSDAVLQGFSLLLQEIAKLREQSVTHQAPEDREISIEKGSDGKWIGIVKVK